MDDSENTAHWERNAAEWVRLVRLGYDRARDFVNNPSFFALLPDVRGLCGLDVGCGEGYNTRLVVERGARMVGLDVASGMVRAAAAEGGARYVRGSGLMLPFGDGQFDFAVAFMSLMDLPDRRRALAEIRRVVRAGGFLQLSILHPCFARPPFEWIKDDDGVKRARVVSDYFVERAGDVEEWTFNAARADGLETVPFQVPRFDATLATWLNDVADAGWQLERVAEPRPDAATVARFPHLAYTAVVPWFLQLRLRKP
jgi:ubiquinone/menaquinone biosynthesis C-methylase UbiE